MALEEVLSLADQFATGSCGPSSMDQTWDQFMTALLMAISHQSSNSEELTKQSNIDRILRLIDVQPLSESAFKCLVNISAFRLGARALLSNGEGVRASRLVNQLLDPEFIMADLAGRALMNLSREVELAELLWDQLSKQGESDSTIDRLAHAICVSGYNRRGCSLDSAAGLLQNLAQLRAPRSRLVATDRGAGVIGRITGCLTASGAVATLSEDRRRYLYGLLKNLCFSSELHPVLCAPQSGLVVALAMPLAGPEDVIDDEDMAQLPPELQYLPGSPDAVRGDEWTLGCCLDALLLICASPVGRDHLKASKVYFILREVHKAPKMPPRIRLAVERVVDVLIVEEPISGDLLETPVPPEVAQRLSTSDAIMCGNSADEDTAGC